MKTNAEASKLELIMSFTAKKELLESSNTLTPIAEHLDLIILLPEYVVDGFKGENGEEVLKAMDITAEVEKINLLKMKGIPLEKLIFGLHFVGASTESGTIKPIFYRSICSLSSRYERNFDKKTSVATMTFKGKMILYLNSRSIANRVRFATKQGLAGALADKIEADDNDGKCKSDEGTFDDFKPVADCVEIQKPERDSYKYPLLRSINQAISVALDELDQEKCADVTPAPPGLEPGPGPEPEPEPAPEDKDKDKDNGTNIIHSKGIAFTTTSVIVAFLLL